MFPILFAAARSAWVAILFVIVAVLAGWFVFRIFGDAFAWVRDEVFDEFRDLRKESAERRKTEMKEKREQMEAEPTAPDESTPEDHPHVAIVPADDPSEEDNAEKDT